MIGRLIEVRPDGTRLLASGCREEDRFLEIDNFNIRAKFNRGELLQFS